MNERLKEIAEQAWEATAVSPDFGHPVSFAEKFAELILFECVKIAVFKGDTATAKEIKEHFGLK